jgi:hypothetical protein
MKKFSAIFLGAVLASGAAMAGDKEHDKQAQAVESTPWHDLAFEDLDVNQDSLISAQEATESQILDSASFASADANQDGFLSRTEFDAGGASGSELEDVDPAADLEDLGDDS